MLSRVYNAIKVSYQIALKYRIAPFWNVARVLPNIFPQAFRMDMAFRRLPTVPRGTWLRGARLVLRGGRGFRPLTSVIINRKRTFYGGKEDFIKPQLFLRKRLRTEDTFAYIRNVFGTKVRYNQDLAAEEAPNSLDFYDIGRNIGMGCNAAVYALRLKTPARILDENQPSTSVNEEYPLALKLMFNFDFQLSEQGLWQSMGTELVPLPKSAALLKGKMSRYRPLPRNHPNIVRLLTAFTDDFRVLPDAREKYPGALPECQTYDLIIDQPRTLYIVMKRYTMTLADYVRFYKRNYWTGKVLFGQLLEGCVFLYDNKISQRDMKSDNILLQFNDGDSEAPHLVISDFGCALATGSWKLPDEYANLGGNVRTRAPEIRTARPDPEMILDFRMADSWAAGTIAYEIFTRNNPFYAELNSDSYLESEVPSLPRKLHYAVRDVVRGLLRRDPEERLLPHIAANVVCLSLFRFGADVQGFFKECGLTGLSGLQLKSSVCKSLRSFGEKAERALDGVLCLLAAESITARGLKPPVISSAELQLRATFLARIDRAHLWEAISFFFTGDRLSLNTVMDSPDVPNGIILSPRIASR